MNVQELNYRYNPYTFARVSAMKSLLLEKHDYEKMMKMKPNEIVKYMQEGAYSDEINDLSVRYSGSELIDHALKNHLGKIFDKLRRISDTSIQILFDQYLKRYDLWNLKLLIRAKANKEREIRDLIFPGGTLKKEMINQLIELGSVEEILTKSKIVDIKSLQESISKYKTTGNLMHIENMLDYLYLVESIEFSKKIPEQGRLFKEFFRYEADIHNLKLILKKIIYKLDKSDIEKYLVSGGRNLKRKLIKNLLNAKEINEVKVELTENIFSRVFSMGDNLMLYEVELERILLEKSILLFHQHPLSVDVILGYMFAKEIEVRNIRAIFKSKVLDIDEKYVKERIIL